MREEVFNDVYPHYLCDYTNGETLETLRTKWGYPDRESLRCDFKNERKRRNIPSKDSSGLVVRKTYDKPRIAVCDIETLPIISYSWGIWEQNIGLEQIIADGCLLGWAGKFLNEPEMHSDILSPREARFRDTKRIAKSIWDFLSQADVVIGHNFVNFDSRYINTEFLRHNLPPLKYTVIDTLLVAKQNFKFSSNKLKFINEQLGIKNKIDNSGFSLWKGCDEGNEESLATMLEYNIGDIGATEELFYKLRPYVRNFNVALYNEIDKPQCPVCGSMNLVKEGKPYTTTAGLWDSIRCNDCKCVSRAKTNLLTKNKRKSLLVNS